MTYNYKDEMISLTSFQQWFQFIDVSLKLPVHSYFLHFHLQLIKHLTNLIRNIASWVNK